MSKRKKEVDLLAGDAITEEAMEAYLAGTLSAEERTQFEKLLADDPFAQDALEGMQAAPNRAETQTRIAGIKKKIRAQTGGREHKTVKIHWVNYAWAAVVLGMLVGIGFLMVSYLNKQHGTDAPIAQNKQDQSIIEPQKTESTVSTATEDALTPTLQKETEPSTSTITNKYVYDSAVTSVAPIQQQVNNTQATSPTAEAKVPVSEYRKKGLVADSLAWKDNSGFTLNNYSSSSNIGLGNNIPPSAKQRKETLKTKGAMQNAPAYGADNQTRRAEPVKTDTGEADNKLLETVVVTNSKLAEGKKIEDTKAASGGRSNVPTQADAMKNFNAGNYKESAEQFDAILKSQPNNADAQYFGGVSEYLNGNLNKSEKSFDKLLKSGDRYVEGSKWYKANILIKKGKKDDAKKILNELSNTSNPYKERATNKLKEL